MTTIRILSAALLVASIALTATAQAQTAAPASAPVAGAAMSTDCPKPMAKHDHAAEKGNPRPMSMSAGCPPAKATSALSAASAAEKRRLRHEHARDGK